jgi:hypothetical protein
MADISVAPEVLVRAAALHEIGPEDPGIGDDLVTDLRDHDVLLRIAVDERRVVELQLLEIGDLLDTVHRLRRGRDAKHGGQVIFAAVVAKA